ncbi:GDSL-type esterase/lipase family protein [Portibacter marinus]|uniref:GDSL-type esterase/lipase family protein n=1 Tax=Portibacter marinus TaxID=2898660 RepID=UPI001F2C706F|nr:GDSL-type esterase/lipase family protein [Portibacter marinus]
MRILMMLIIGFWFYVNGAAQDELKWKKEIERLTAIEVQEVENAEGLILLTGSSSARMWKNFGDVFPNYKTANHGFGGSQMHELLYYLDDLVIQYNPDIILIYEGDNDLSAGKTIEQIMLTTEAVVDKIKDALPEAEIYFISPKPSLARWNLEQEYVDLNGKMKSYSEQTQNVHFIDVWFPMLNENGKPMEDIFIEDGLHMNQKGYEIWKSVILKKVAHTTE